MDAPWATMDLFTIYMALGTFIADHISLLHPVMVGHMQNLLWEFYDVLVCT